jgi:hypothetical protein
MRNFISQNGPNGWFSEFDHPNLGMIGRFCFPIGLCALGGPTSVKLQVPLRLKRFGVRAQIMASVPRSIVTLS